MKAEAQRGCNCGGTCGKCSAPRAPRSVHDALRTPGRPLDDRARFESRFNTDFTRVRVHHDRRSNADVDARAYTVGNHIVFGETPSHDVLAHELSHVVHQRHAPHASLQRLPNGGVQDPVHHGLVEEFRGDFGTTDDMLSDADIKYRSGPREDLTRLRVDALPDMTRAAFTPRDVRPHVNDTSVVSLSWQLIGPDSRIRRSMATTSRDADALTRPFRLESSDFSGASFQEGLYHLTCTANDASGWARLRTRRDFRMLSGDYSGSLRTHGAFNFTRYDKTDAPAPGGRYYIFTRLEFDPHPSVTCSQIGWIQTVQSLTPTGEANPSRADLGARSTAVSWAIDRKAGPPSPFYGTWTNAATGNIEMPEGFGHFTGPTHPETELRDRPNAQREQQRRFESCAVCRSGGTAGEFYGCATWGYTADANGRVTLHPRSFADAPTEEFIEARQMWNQWRETLPAASRPEAAPELREAPRPR